MFSRPFPQGTYFAYDPSVGSCSFWWVARSHVLFFFVCFFGSRWVGCRLPEIPIQKSTGTGRSALDPLWPRLCLYWPASRYADGALGFTWFQAPREGESLIAFVVVVCCRIERHQVDKTVMIPDDLKRGDVDGIDLPPVLSNVCHVWIRLHIQHCVVHL